VYVCVVWVCVCVCVCVCVVCVGVVSVTQLATRMRRIVLSSVACTAVACVWNVKPDFVFPRNGRVNLNRRGASVQSTTGSRGARISGSNAGYTVFLGSVKGTGYPLHSPVSPSLPLSCVTVCHHISTGFYHHFVHIRKVLRPATSTQDFLGFHVPISKCWDGSQHSKLALHASHVALRT
jgi:hypothetical protein